MGYMRLDMTAVDKGVASQGCFDGSFDISQIHGGSNDDVIEDARDPVQGTQRACGLFLLLLPLDAAAMGHPPLGHLNLDRLRHQAVPLEAAHRRERDIVIVPLLIEGNDNANPVGDMIDVSYAPGGALGCTFFPEAVDVSAQFNGSALDRDADLREAGAEFPADLILDIMLQFCVTPHGLALGPHGTDRRFPPECISHCSAAFYLKIRMKTGARAACGRRFIEPR